MRKQGYRGAFRKLLSLTGAVAMLLSFILPPTAVHSTEQEQSVQSQTITFDAATDKQLFKLYSSSMGSFSVKNGKLTPTGTSGEFKAIYIDQDAHFQSVSVDLHPGTKGINGGLYINASDPAHGREKITGLGVMVQSNHTGWEDAPNRIDLIVCSFPGWTELQRTISETGAGNALFAGGVKEPLNLKVDISGNQLTVTLSLLSDASKFITTTYIHSGTEDLGLGDVGVRSDLCNGTFDNFTMVTTVPESEEPETTEPEVDETVIATDVVDFASQNSNAKFDFYHSSNGGFAVQNGKLVPTGAVGEFKAIYKENSEEIRSVSVELHPVGTDGPIFGGLYIDAKNPAHGQDQIDALYIGIESHFTGWSDALNRIDVVVGSFPSWVELSRTISETGNGNNLFSGGVKEPIKLQADIDGNVVTITVSLVSDPSKQVVTTYTAAAGVDLSAGSVGIRSHHNNAHYDNFTVSYVTDDVPEVTEPEVTEPEVTEPEVTEPTPTDLVDFESQESGDKFDFYHSSQGGFAVQDGKLVPTGEEGEFKAIYKDANASFSYLSVDIYPGEKGINGGLYLDVTEVDHPVDRVEGLYIGIESDFPKAGEATWEDAPNRLDLVIGKFPQWQELHRVVSEAGVGNNLFSGGIKEPVKLTVAINGNELTVTVSLLSDPDKQISTTYIYGVGQDIALGNVGIRSAFNDASYDNFAVVYSQVEEDKQPDQTEPEEPVPVIVPTDIVDFENTVSNEKFNFYHSSNGGFTVQDGKLVPTGDAGEFKAIYKDINASFSYVSVDIYPGEKGINGGLYLDVTEVGHPVDRVEGLYIGIESDFPKEGEATWEDAPNRLDLVIGKFPQWQELHRVVSETGAGNNLFAGGVKEPVKLSVELEGNELTITVSLLSNPDKQISATHVYENGQDIALGNVGIRSAFNDASYDNFAVVYSQVEADKQSDQTEPEETIPEFVPTDTLDFENQDSGKKFDFYHSSNGGFAVKDGKLVPTGEEGEFKAIYRDGGNAVQAVSVDIYPGESGQINSGLYIGTSTVEDGVDRIKGLVVMVESNMTGWDDAINRIDIVVGRFPIWKELHRYTSETGNGNALFAGAKEPLNLTVFISGNKLTVKLSLLSDPEKYVTTVYEYNGATKLSAHNVGLRSAFNDVSFDDFSVCSLEGGGSQDPDKSASTGSTGSTGNTGNSGNAGGTNTTPDTGDHFQPGFVFMLMVLSVAAIVILVCKNKKLT